MLIGFDIGGTKCAVVLGDVNGKVHHKIRFETHSERGPKPILSELKAAALALVAPLKPGEIQAAGISCGGPLDSRSGKILSPPNLPGWDEIPIVELVESWLGIPAALQNDANACALAEWKYGAGKGCQNMIFLTFGTGMGAGLILNGRLYSGTNDLAGEVGHIRLAQEGPVGFGKSGSFEGFCSGGGIARQAAIAIQKAKEQGQASKLMEFRNPSAKDVFEACDSGDKLAMSIVADVGRKLGHGLAILIDILNPERIVIGSIFARSGHLLTDHMNEVLREEAIPSALRVCKILPANLGESLGDVAALAVAAQKMQA